VRDRVRPPARPTTVAARWSEQFLAPISGQLDGATLVVEAGGTGEPWVGVLPADAFGGRAQRRSWSEATTVVTRFDRVVVPLEVGASVGTAALLDGVSRRLAPDGTAYVVVPGPALDPARPDADAVVGLAAAALPHHLVEVESFGNATTAASLDAPARTLGPLVDRHDPAVPVVLGVNIAPAGCAR
jgi:hypothetical protein